jgi:glucose-6-phosphate 1-dehydrogenase
VAHASRTETFVALKLEIANWRWQGVPFYLRTGKRLAERASRVVVNFRCPRVSLFAPFESCHIRPNRLVITIQPNEGFDLFFEMKAPGQPVRVETQSLRFRYAEAFSRRIPEAYERDPAAGGDGGRSDALRPLRLGGGVLAAVHATAGRGSSCLRVSRRKLGAE